MYKGEIEIRNESGLHARPASLFVKVASEYKSEIKVIKDNQEYNAKSIMGILSMGSSKGDVLTILAEGTDEKKAVEALIGIVRSKFDES